jgi:phosphoglycerate kinase
MFPQRAAGLLVEKELSSLGRVIANQARPFVAILGGAKVSDKIEVIEALLGKVDALLIGGAMANTFLAAQGLDMKRSRVEADKLPLARTLMEKAKARGVALLLPVDVVAAPTLEAKSGTVVATNALPDDGMALDIGPATTQNFAARIADAKTIFWNGPMGLFEKAPFAAGSIGVAKAMAASEGFTVIGGGDSAAAVKVAGGDIASKIDHISTGGGASLELIEGKKLPGIEVLRSLQ